MVASDTCGLSKYINVVTSKMKPVHASPFSQQNCSVVIIILWVTEVSVVNGRFLSGKIDQIEY